MIQPDQIPPEAVEAAAKADYEAWRDRQYIYDETLPWEDVAEETREAGFASARAALAAALAAWPGVAWQSGGDGTERPLLPLPPEGGER